MSPNKKTSGRNRIPIEFVDPEQENEISSESQAVDEPQRQEDEPGRDVIPDEFADADVDCSRI